MLHTCAGHSARIAGEPYTAGFAITPYQFPKKRGKKNPRETDCNVLRLVLSA